jgi:hypothetical protein
MISVGDFLDLYRQQSLHRIAMTALTQSGFEIDGTSLQPRDLASKIAQSHEMIRTDYSPKATYEVKVPVDSANPGRGHYLHRKFYPWAEGTHEISWLFDLYQAGNMRSPYIDHKRLLKHVEALEEANADIEHYPFDFGVVYHLSQKKQ